MKSMSATPPYSVKETKKSLSVITINFNNREGLRRTIESVVAQTTRDFEYIIIDGGSTDGSVDVIKEYADHIDYWVSEPDNGIYNAMNKGVRVAHGEYCNFMNSGDSYHSNIVVEKFIDSKPFADIIVGSTNRVEYKGKDIIIAKGLIRPISEVITDFFLFSAISHQSSFIRTKLLQDNPYDENLKIVSDWKFFIEELIVNQHSYVSLDLIVADFDASGISSNDQYHKLYLQERTEVLHSLFPPKLIDDFVAKTKGRTPLERMIFYSRPNGFFIKMITAIGVIYAKAIKFSQIFR